MNAVRRAVLRLAPEWDPQFTRATAVSLLLHLVVLAALIVVGRATPPRPLPMSAYTVELTDPAALGGRLPPGPLDKPLGPSGRPGGRGEERAPTVAPSTEASGVQLAEVPPGPTPAQPSEPRGDSTVERGAVPSPQAKAAETAPVPQAAAPPVVEKPEPKKAVEPPKPEPKKAVEPPKPEPKKAVEPPKPEPKKAVEPPKPEPKKAVEPPKPEPKKAVEPPKPEPKKAVEPPKPEPKKAVEPPTPQPPETNKGPAEAAKGTQGKPAESPPSRSLPAAGGATSGGATGAPAGQGPEKDAYALAMERRLRAGGGGGVGGASENSAGPIGVGGEGSGGGGQLVGLEFLRYRQLVIDTVKANWANPLRRSGLVAKVRFRIAPDGAISEARVTTSSGDAAYDQSAVRAVLRANPLPPPPASYRNEFSEFLIEFHSQDQGGRGSG